MAYIEDIVVPVAWTTIDDRNNTLYMALDNHGIYSFRTLTMPNGNYTGATFATEFQTQMNIALAGLPTIITVDHQHMDNILTINTTDERPIASAPLVLILIGHDDLKRGVFGTTINNTRTLNNVLRVDKSLHIGSFAKIQIDLHTTRNLYLTSSSLASYNCVSNFGNDTIIKKIPVKASYNEMLIHEGGSGFDYLDVSKRSLRYIDFKLVDSYFNTIELRGNHLSFSIIFQQQH